MMLTAEKLDEIQSIYDNLIFELINLKKSIQNFNVETRSPIDVSRPSEKIKLELQKILYHKISDRNIADLDPELVPLADKISVTRIAPDSQGETERFKISSDDPYVKVLLTANQRVVRNISYYQRTVLNTAVVNLASLFENTMKQLAQFTVLNFTEKVKLKNESRLSLMSVLMSDSIEELKEEVLQRYFADLTYDSVDGWLSTVLQLISGRSISKQYLNVFKELFERRNIIVHNKSVVNTKYLDKITDTDFKKGDVVTTDSDYIDNLIVLVIDVSVDLLIGAIPKWDMSNKLKRSFLAYLNDAALPFYDEQQFKFGVAYYKKMRAVSRKSLGKKSLNVFSVSYNYYLGLKFLDKLNTPELQKEVINFFSFFKQVELWDKLPKEVTLLPEVSLTKELSEFANILVDYADEVKEEHDVDLAQVLSWPMTALLQDNKIWKDYLNDFYRQVW
ncbi:hypothetical protein G9406_06670 [Weissella paramesenteroides]|nr:hypothetical protein [Weissella paramesenteroides]